MGKLYRVNCHTVSPPRCFSAVTRVASRSSVHGIRGATNKWESKRVLSPNSSFKGGVKVKQVIGQKVAFGDFKYVNRCGNSASGSVEIMHRSSRI